MRRLRLALLATLPLLGAKKPSAELQIPLDQYIQQVNQRSHQFSSASPGSLYTSSGRLADGFRDVRASQVYDLVTIVVNENTSAVSTGTTKTSRASSVAASVASGLLPKGSVKALSNLATTSNNQALNGQGTTTRGTTLTTTVSAEVTAVLPNGNLVVQGQKAIMVNSEKQIITLRGIVRPDDLSPLNSVSADRVARMEILVNGKGVVNDAVKRPFILYRLLLGLLPF
ncbi:MAG TPA: flagellar basal body L-ring protein FlgH [Bryobacteraceae bacterium]|jgi:flagellar L-ring protein precursor FlgH|nr:flagellar basal body L-ring protein FlgH [Bryobacteraceae bacterium]